MSETQLRTRQHGAALRAIRKARNIGTSEMAGACGIHPQHVVNIENGSRNCPGDLLAAMANILNCPIAAVLRDPDDPDAQAAENGAAA